MADEKGLACMFVGAKLERDFHALYDDILDYDFDSALDHMSRIEMSFYESGGCGIDIDSLEGSLKKLQEGLRKMDSKAFEDAYMLEKAIISQELEGYREKRPRL